MAKRTIVWTVRAKEVFHPILSFYNDRNGNTSYANKLNEEVYQLISLLVRFPNLGKKVHAESYRFLVHGNYKIFYTITFTEIVINLIWDTRQNPEELKF